MAGGLFSNRGTHQGRAFKRWRAGQANDTLDRFAELLAEDPAGDTARAAARMGFSPAYGRALLKRLRERINKAQRSAGYGDWAI